MGYIKKRWTTFLAVGIAVVVVGISFFNHSTKKTAGPATPPPVQQSAPIANVGGVAPTAPLGGLPVAQQALGYTALAAGAGLLLLYWPGWFVSRGKRPAGWTPTLAGQAPTCLRYSLMTRMVLTGLGAVWAAGFAGIAFMGFISSTSDPGDAPSLYGFMTLGWLGLGLCAVSSSLPRVRFNGQWVEQRGVIGWSEIALWKDIEKIQQDKFGFFHLQGRDGTDSKFDSMIANLESLLRAAPVPVERLPEAQLRKARKRAVLRDKVERNRYFLSRTPASYGFLGVLVGLVLLMVGLLELYSTARAHMVDAVVTDSRLGTFESSTHTVSDILYLHLRGDERREVNVDLGAPDPTHKDIVDRLAPGTPVRLRLSLPITESDGPKKFGRAYSLAIRHGVAAQADDVILPDQSLTNLGLGLLMVAGGVLGIFGGLWAYRWLRRQQQWVKKMKAQGY